MDKKIIFVTNKENKTKNFWFCDLDCDKCLIKFACLTTNASGFGISHDDVSYDIEYYYDSNCEKKFFLAINDKIKEISEREGSM